MGFRESCFKPAKVLQEVYDIHQRQLEVTSQGQHKQLFSIKKRSIVGIFMSYNFQFIEVNKNPKAVAIFFVSINNLCYPGDVT